MNRRLLVFGTLFIIFVLYLPNTALAGTTLTIFVGAASKPATEEAIKLFEKETGVEVNVSFGGSGFVLSQMILARKGDIYFPGSSDYMEKAKTEGYVYPNTEKVIVHLVSAINVQKGNPKNIRTLKDLTKPGIKVAIANPQGVCVGAYAVEIIENNFSTAEKEKFLCNLINYTGSCAKTASAISLKTVDAVIGWRVFKYWDPNRIETIPLQPSEINRIGYIPIAISTFTKQPKLAQEFIDFMLSDKVKIIFSKYNYFMTSEEAAAWIGEKKPIGGVYKVPIRWLSK